MSYRKENRNLPAGQGTDIYNIYGGRDNRPMTAMRESRHLNNNGNHHELEQQYHSLYDETPIGTLESRRSEPRSDHSHPSSHRSSNLPAAESTGHSYANVEESEQNTIERNISPSRRRRQPMNQLTRV